MMAIIAVRKPRRPRYTAGSMLQLINNIARSIEVDGKLTDIALRAALKRELEHRPELLDLYRVTRDWCRWFARKNNEAVNRAGATFVPSALVTVGRGQRCRMRNLVLPADLLAWGKVDDESEAHFLQTMARKRQYREQCLAEAVANPGCHNLGELEGVLRGYVPSERDDALFDVDDDASGDDDE